MRSLLCWAICFYATRSPFSVPLKLLFLGDSINAETACSATTNSIWQNDIKLCRLFAPFSSLSRLLILIHFLSRTSGFGFFKICFRFNFLCVWIFFGKIVRDEFRVCVLLFYGNETNRNTKAKAGEVLKDYWKVVSEQKICDKFSVDGLKWFADINQ